MLEKSSNRIAKNTLLLYCRMILTMIVSLYTSKIVLNALGVIDYGVYDVVGGVVTMLSFFNTSISTSTQRFLNAGMVENDGKDLNKIFSSSVNVHIIIGLIAIFILETGGIWFVENKLVIPEDKKIAAFWVFQCSIATFFVSIISAPYNAALIAYEKMSAFAWFSIIEVCLKLAVAIIILNALGQKLVLYAFLLMCVSLTMRLIYGIYCSKIFKDIRYRLIWNPNLMKRLLSFSGWMIFGCLSDLLGTQGVSFLINIYFGPIFNASRALAIQVQSAVAQFSSNFIVSVNPQIIQSYLSKDYDYAYRLVFTASKLSFFLMYILVVPIILKSQTILHIWLDNVPPLTPIFVNIILIEYLIRSSYTPIAQINQASGNVKAYQLSIAVLFALNFFATYFLFKSGFPVYSTFIFSCIIAVLGLIARLAIIKYQQGFPAMEYLKDVSLKLGLTFFIGFSICYLFNRWIADNLLGIILMSAISLLINGSLSWFIGFNKTEKLFIRNKATLLYNKVFAR